MQRSVKTGEKWKEKRSVRKGKTERDFLFSAGKAGGIRRGTEVSQPYTIPASNAFGLPPSVWTVTVLRQPVRGEPLNPPLKV